MPPAALRRSQRKLLLFFLKCIVMIAVISVFLFFLGFAAVVLLHFLLLSNRRHRRPAESAPSSSLAPDNVVYTEAEFPGFSDCAICLDSFEEGDVCRDLPDCKHLFHARCVDRWIEKKPNCPVCRTRVDFGSPDSSGISGEERWKRLWVVNFEHGASIS